MLSINTQLNGDTGAILASADPSTLHRTRERVNRELVRLNALQRAIDNELHVRSRGHNDPGGCVARARCSDVDPDAVHNLKSTHPYRAPTAVNNGPEDNGVGSDAWHPASWGPANDRPTDPRPPWAT